VRLAHHAVVVLQDQRARAVQHADAVLGYARGVASAQKPEASGLDADLAYAGVAEERVEQPDGVAAAAHARDQHVGQAAGKRGELPPRLDPDHAVEVAHHHRERMRAQHRAEHVVRVAHARHPVAHGLVDGVLERARAGVHLAYLGAEQTHALDVELLAARVLAAHVHRALEPEARRGRSRRDAVLACAGLGDHALLAHAHGEQALADRVVDLVRAGVQQVLALEEHAAARGLGQPPRLDQRRRAAREVAQRVRQLAAEALVGLRANVLALQFLERVDQRFGNELAAVGAEVAGGVRKRLDLAHRTPVRRRGSAARVPGP